MFQVDKKSLAKLQRNLARDFPRFAAKEGRLVIKKAVTELRKNIRAAAPVEDGDLRRAIYVKVLRDKIGEPHAADVRIKTGKKNAAKNRDGFYWRFHEYGTIKMPARPFVAPTVEKFKPVLARYFKEYGDLIAGKFNKS